MIYCLLQLCLKIFFVTVNELLVSHFQDQCLATFAFKLKTIPINCVSLGFKRLNQAFILHPEFSDLKKVE